MNSGGRIVATQDVEDFSSSDAGFTATGYGEAGAVIGRSESHLVTSHQAPSAAIPLAVDLDGTLIYTDMLWESLICLVKQNIFCVFLVPIWLAKGKASLKNQIATRITLDVSALPYNDDFVNFLRDEWRSGRQLVLTTGAATHIAQQIADHLGIFAEVLASSSKNNMTGKRKARALQDKFGPKGFEYAGNENADLKVWEASCGAIVVNAPERLVLKVKKVARLSRSFQRKQNRISTFLRMIRAKHG